MANLQVDLQAYNQLFGPAITEAEFLKLAVDVVAPGFAKYKKLLLLPHPGPGEQLSDLMKAKHAFKACKLFDPMFLKTEPSAQALEVVTENIKFFGFRHFTDEFIQNMKAEIPAVIELAKKPFD